MNRILPAAALGALIATGAQAAEFNQVRADQSRIEFGYTQMGVAMDGRFKTFSAQLRFDPAQPEGARAAVEVDLASIDTGTAEADAEVAGRQWFNTPAFPTARFESASVKPLGDHRYEVTGTLSIKGKTREVVVPATFSPQGAAGVFAGTFTIRRGDFAIGEGPWSAFDIVANDVPVRFHIIAATGR